MPSLAALLLLFAVPYAHGEFPSCSALRPAARKIKIAFPKSTPDIKNCAQIGDTPSNYIIKTDPEAPLELHVVSVGEGSFPANLARGGPDAPEKAVRVIVYDTDKPAMLVLNAAEPVLWDLTITKGADIDRIVVQGRGEQQVRGVPDGIPVIHRPADRACASSHGWEKEFNRRGADYRQLITSIRCATGLRETSFQGCAAGGIFEIPHYRTQDNLPQAEDWSPPCPLPVEPEIISPVLASYRNRPEHSGTKLPGPRAAPARRAQPVRAASRHAATARPAPAAPGPEPFPEHEAGALAPPKAVPARRGIPVRALAILLEGSDHLATHDAIPDLIIALERGDARLRARAADELGKMGETAEDAARPLIQALRKDNSLRVRASAALALGNIGPAGRKAVPDLKKALRSEDANLRLSAETALERIGTEKALRVLKNYRGK
ncbi:MAG: HEAT repeat domain-containing protein [Elusimicrobiota bacterium]